MGNRIVIVGCGIVGLYTGYVLSQQGKASDITYYAEYLPGDQSGAYTSPWAGANFSTVSGSDANSLRHDKLTYCNIKTLYERFGKEAGIDRLPSTEYFELEPPPANKLASLKSYVVDYQVLDKSSLPAGISFGHRFTTYNFNSPKFLQFLKSYLQGQGATFIRKKLSNISDAWASSNTQVVFNCTGIGARHLEGVKDKKVYPTRGQVVVVKASHVKENMAVIGKFSSTYMIPRPHSGGLVILGGFMQKSNWNTSTFGYETASILDRSTRHFAVPLCSQPFEVIRECAGLRPSRDGGVRIEKEYPAQSKILIHNYGAGGYGYQSGLGMAIEAVSLLNDSKL